MKKYTYQFVHSINGFADEVKTVEVDGKKFISEDGKEPKKDDKGLPIPFVDTKKEDQFDASKASLEDLAKVNPTIRKMLDDQAKAALDAKKLADDEAGKKGEWEKLAKDREIEINTIKADNEKKSEIVGKYIESTKKVLANVFETIPKEKRGLVPASFSPREQLEYIIENAELLGAKVTNAKGTIVPENDGKPNATDEEKLQTEVNELIKKGATRTMTESQILWEKSQALKKLQTARLSKK